MAKLRLIQPRALAEPLSSERPLLVSVVVDVPAIHLDGEYTYLATEGAVSVGSLVMVPFSHGETFGFVTGIADNSHSDRSLKWIKKVIVKEPLFDENALKRYRRIADGYGASLISILKLGIPVRRPILKKIDAAQEIAQPSPSVVDEKYLNSIFGSEWKRSEKVHLLLPPGALWDRIAISIYLAIPKKTLILVPTEQDLDELRLSLDKRGMTDYSQLTSTQKASERNREFLRLIEGPSQLVIGTRAATFAPISPEQVIILDPGHEGYQERRSPYSRSDDSLIWEGKVITINHSRQLTALAAGESYLIGKGSTALSVKPTSSDRAVEDLQREVRGHSGSSVVLLSINDPSFASGLRCALCKNASRCGCGFPLRIATRGADPSCSKCFKIFNDYLCPHCGASELRASRGGNRSWALTLAKSIKGTRVILSEPSNMKSRIERPLKGIILVIAEHHCEPRVIRADGQSDGYDAIIAIGGRSGFNSSTLTKNDRFRMRWARLRGLLHPNKATIFLDLDQEHPEFAELRNPAGGRGLEVVLTERRALSLPPYALLAELSGSDAALHQLKKSLENDQLFRQKSNEIFPVHEGKMILKVDPKYRYELMKLLQAMVRLRSSKRLTTITFILSPSHL